MATNETPTPIRRWSPAEISDFSHLSLPASVGTLEPAGFPRVLPCGSCEKTEACSDHILIGFRISSNRDRKKGRR